LLQIVIREEREKGSAGEVRSLLRVALEVGYLDTSTHSQLSNLAIELSRMLSKQIQSLNPTPPT